MWSRKSGGRQADASAEICVGRRAVLGGLAAGVFAPFIAGCSGGGFRPVHASSAFGGSETSEKLRGVQIGTIPGRVGQQLRNDLIFYTSGGAGETLEPVYTLDFAIREYVTSTLIRSDGDAVGQVYNLDAAFRLTDLRSKSAVLEGTSYGRAGFERNASIFANVRAREDAEKRAAKTVANDLRSRLTAFLANA